MFVTNSYLVTAVQKLLKSVMATLAPSRTTAYNDTIISWYKLY